jgi:hypothetical protein
MNYQIKREGKMVNKYGDTSCRLGGGDLGAAGCREEKS